VSQLTTAGAREFQVAGAAPIKDRLPMLVRLKGTSRSGTAVKEFNSKYKKDALNGL